MAPPPSLLWDIFCKVIDNHGDIGVCWRLACGLAARGQRVRLWVNDASALAWIAPQGCPVLAADGSRAVEVLAWHAQTAWPAPGDVILEAFGCDIADALQTWSAINSIAAYARIHWAKDSFYLQNNSSSDRAAPLWINLEYLSAEPFAARNHGLPSPVLQGPAKGATKWFFYPGFTVQTGGLLRETGGLPRETDIAQRQARFDVAAWQKQHLAGGTDTAAVRRISLFCYEPAALGGFLKQLGDAPQPTQLIVTAGRATHAVQQLFIQEKGKMPNEYGRKQLSISYQPYLSQTDFDHLLWACDFNCVRGEDSLVRALWAGQPFVWHIYPQDDGAHAAKLDAFLDWLQAPADLRQFHHVWNGLSAAVLPALNLVAWTQVVRAAGARLRAQQDLVTQLLDFAQEKRVK